MKRSYQILLVVLGCILFFILTACGERRIISREAAAREQVKPEVLRGAWLYVEYACVQCHGLGGKGRSAIQPVGVSLVSTEFKRAFPRATSFDQALVNIIKNGSITEGDRTASMPAWNGILAEQEMWYIVSYIRAGLPDLGVPLLSTGTGEQIYRAFACIKCHGPLGTGGVRNVAVTNPDHQVIPPLGGPEFRKKYPDSETVRKVILNGRLVEGGRTGVVYAPAWGKIGTAEQIEKVLDYLYSY